MEAWTRFQKEIEEEKRQLQDIQRILSSPEIPEYIYYIFPLSTISQHKNPIIVQKMLKQCLEEILSILNTALGYKSENAHFYFYLLQTIIKNEVDKDALSNFSVSLENIVQELEQLEIELQSELLFPKHLVKVYPNIKEVKAKQRTLCDISGDIISPGSHYLYYRPLLHDISAHKSYVLKRSMKVYPSYSSMLPTDIKSFEYFHNALLTSYNEQGENSLYYDISTNIGNNALTLQLLGRKRNK